MAFFHFYNFIAIPLSLVSEASCPKQQTTSVFPVRLFTFSHRNRKIPFLQAREHPSYQTLRVHQKNLSVVENTIQYDTTFAAKGREKRATHKDRGSGTHVVVDCGFSTFREPYQESKPEDVGGNDNNDKRNSNINSNNKVVQAELCVARSGPFYGVFDSTLTKAHHFRGNFPTTNAKLLSCVLSAPRTRESSVFRNFVNYVFYLELRVRPFRVRGLRAILHFCGRRAPKLCRSQPVHALINAETMRFLVSGLAVRMIWHGRRTHALTVVPPRCARRRGTTD